MRTGFMSWRRKTLPRCNAGAKGAEVAHTGFHEAMCLAFAPLTCGEEEHVIRQTPRLDPVLRSEEDPRTHKKCDDHHAKWASLGYGRSLRPRLPEKRTNLERHL